MAGEKVKSKAKSKKLTVKKAPIKDLGVKKGKDVKGGVFPSDRKRFEGIC